jgi:hypothetical protein
MYLYLARNYRDIDNLSKEIGALKEYLEHYPGGNEAGFARSRLLRTCTESGDFELASKLWLDMDSLAREDKDNLETWLELNRMQGKDPVCDSLDPDSEPALKWLGQSYFWKAENSYQYQMKTYQENHTRRQYAILLKAFRQVS